MCTQLLAVSTPAVVKPFNTGELPTTGAPVKLTLKESDLIAEAVDGFLVTVRAVGGSVFVAHGGDDSPGVVNLAAYIVEEDTALQLAPFVAGSADGKVLALLAAEDAGVSASITIMPLRLPERTARGN